MNPTSRAARSVLVVMLVMVLAACGAAPLAGSNDQAPDAGGTRLLPAIMPVGEDPTAEHADCVVVGMSFDDDVTIPAGASCAFTDVVIDGNVVLAHGASLVAVGGAVAGNVLVYPAASFDADRTVVDGNVQAERSVAVRLVMVRLDGDVQTDRTDVTTVEGGRVAGTVQVWDNGSVEVWDNRIEGDLQCEGNTPAPIGGGNRVDGGAEGQCSALGL